MLTPETERTVVSEASVSKLLDTSITVLTGKGIVAFTVEVFSFHSCIHRIRFVLGSELE